MPNSTRATPQAGILRQTKFGQVFFNFYYYIFYWCSEVSHQKAHTQTESNYKLIFLYMLKNIEISGVARLRQARQCLNLKN